MLGNKTNPKRRCGECVNINTKAYGVPVCYRRKTENGKPVAVAVSIRDKQANVCSCYEQRKQA